MFIPSCSSYGDYLEVHGTYLVFMPGDIALLIIGVTPIRLFMEVKSRVISPVIGSN